MANAKRPAGGRLISGACLWLVAAGWGFSAAAADAPIAVRGVVTDAAGEAVPGQTVRLLKSRKYVSMSGMKSTDQDVEETRGATDGHGFFEFSDVPDSSFPSYVLRFYDPQTFDSVKFVLPDDRDISRILKKGKTVQVAVVLEYAPHWTEVKSLIDKVGPGSQVGQVLRALGLPGHREPQEGGRELWTYAQAGVAYVVDGPRVLETRQVPKSAQAAAPAAASPGSEERPVQATRVDTP